jgi:hypothetical protein
MNGRTIARALALALAAAPASAGAQARSLRWDALVVDARLDGAGVLHVVERQDIVFTGAWNGGERVFRIEPGQRLSLERIVRVDADGTVRPLWEADPGVVDRWAWADRDTVRWRSRLPSDPPFDETAITYLLEYTISGVLLDEGDGSFELAHDFVFRDRPGPIRRVRATLALDRGWETSAPLVVEAADLPPGAGAVLTVPLRWVGPGPPPSLGDPFERPFPSRLRIPLLAALAAAMALAAAWPWRHNARRGLSEPLPRADEAWLRSSVLVHRPEVVAAAWAERVEGNAVAALLARMELEGKLTLHDEARFVGPGEVRMRLLVDRSTLDGYERRLVDGLFFAGDTTDTLRLRQQYGKSGFYPATLIAEEVGREATALLPRPGRGRRVPWIGGAVLLLGAAAVLAAIGWIRYRIHPILFLFPPAAPIANDLEPAMVVLPAIGVLVASAFAAVVAATYSRAPAKRTLRAAAAAAPWVLGAAVIAWGAAAGAPLGAVVVAACVWCAGLVLVAGFARTPFTATALGLRRTLEAARRHFARELERREPDLSDAWTPYLVALGLAPAVEQWLGAHAASAAPASFASDRIREDGRERAGAVAAGGGSSPAPARWTGGGGSFSGGGASGTWTALGSLSAGVRSPSESSSSSSSSSGGGGGGRSSGGGGGGGRSGGGGGGGW